MLGFGGSPKQLANSPLGVGIPEANGRYVYRKVIDDSPRKHFILRLHPTIHARVMEFLSVSGDSNNIREGQCASRVEGERANRGIPFFQNFIKEKGQGGFMEQKSFPIHAPKDTQLGREEPTNRDPLLTLGEGNTSNLS